MASKRKGSSPNSNPAPKRARKVLTLEVKVQILDLLKNGEKVVDVARKFEVNESTIRTIRDSEEKIRTSVQQLGAKMRKITSRKGNVEKMEELLIVWMEDKIQKNIPISSAAIREKALYFYDYVDKKSESSSTETFSASKGWLERFKVRFSLHNVKFVGESASADHKAASEFPEQMKALIQAKGYTASQVFNLDETGLFWKRMPNRTFLTRAEQSAPGFKVAKDRYTLLLCANAAGTFKCKPMLIYKSETPRVMKGKRKEHLPVFWKSNKKAWITKLNFEEWFLQSFVPEVKEWLEKQNLAFKVLLLMDNAPSHPTNLTHPNIEICFFPPNTTSLIQPMDQTVISTFKSYYLRRVLREMLKKIDEQSNEQQENNNEGTVRNFWKKFSILDSIRFVHESWTEVSNSTINKSWKKVWPEIVVQTGLEQEQDAIQELLNLARNIGGEGFQDLERSEIVEILALQHAELEPEDIEDLLNEPDEIDEDESTAESSLTLKNVSKILTHLEEAVNEALAFDPIMTRSMKFQRECNIAAAVYTEIQKDFQRNVKQSRVTDFFKPK